MSEADLDALIAAALDRIMASVARRIERHNRSVGQQRRRMRERLTPPPPRAER